MVMPPHCRLFRQHRHHLPQRRKRMHDNLADDQSDGPALISLYGGDVLLEVCKAYVRSLGA